MDPRFLALFTVTTTLLVIAAAAGSSAASGGSLLLGAVATVLGLPAVFGLMALARIVFLDGEASAERGNETRS